MATKPELEQFLTDIADSIRTKKGTNEPINAQNFSSEISSIETGIEPTGTKEIKENGLHDVTEYADVSVDIESGNFDLTSVLLEDGTQEIVATYGGDKGRKYLVQVVDYDGTVLRSAQLSTGYVFEIPEAPPEHEGLIFDRWVCAVEMVNNTVTVTDRDITIGPTYHTASGKTEVDIELTEEFIDKTFEVYLYAEQTIEWGDGTSETASVDGYVTHEYSDYGNYTVMISAGTIIPKFMFNTQQEKTQNCLVKHIRLPNTITDFSRSAFYKCYSLETITTPNNEISTNSNMFLDCWSLKSVTIILNYNVDSYSFQRCYSLESVVLDSSMRGSIGMFGFDECWSLKSITIPESITNLGGCSFSDCFSLQSFVMPDNVNNIGDHVFDGCVCLEHIKLSDGLTKIDGSTFYGCRSLKTITIPDSITSIPGSTFSNCPSLKTVILPTNIDFNGTSVFSQCSSLEKIILPNTVTNLGSYFFSNCTKLKIIKLSENITEINERTFYSCKSLKKIILPDTVTTIKPYAFSGCLNMESIKIPQGVTSISNGVFQQCYNLKVFDIDHRFRNSTFGVLFDNCKLIKVIKGPDLIDTTSVGSMFTNCYNLTNLEIYNIKTSLQIGSGTTWGHLLTLDSLLHTIKELHDMTEESASKELTVGSANLEKLANVYVKLITITDEMRAEDEYVDNKKPFVVCESTDEGAMTVSDYSRLIKNWIIK